MKQLSRKELLVLSPPSDPGADMAGCAPEEPEPAARGMPASLTDRKVRRVVTGYSPSGKAIVVSDTEVEAITNDLAPGIEFYILWGAEEPPTFPDDGSRPPQGMYFPPLGGFRFGLFTVPPASTPAPENVDKQMSFMEFRQKLPGLLEPMESDNPGMHTSDTMDYEYVICGEVVLELDDGVQVKLGPGDTVIQNGTRHAWRNPGTEPCMMAVVLIGANRMAA